jgi:hypothetical protein
VGSANKPRALKLSFEAHSNKKTGGSSAKIKKINFQEKKKKRRLLFGSLSCDCPDMRRWVPAAPANHISKKQ